MAYCPECFVEYMEGKTECIDCHVALRPGPPPAPAADDSGDDVELVSIRDFVGSGAEGWPEGIDPELARAVLEKEGIPAQIAHSPGISMIGPGGATELFVRKEDAVRAAEVLKAFFDAPAEAPGGEGES
ncbi:MAG TPA: hypothetical protein VGW33_06520 [Terriglobia bacterium]|nr:hypothetical protein [Terriglobia bacterium]